MKRYIALKHLYIIYLLVMELLKLVVILHLLNELRSIFFDINSILNLKINENKIVFMLFNWISYNIYNDKNTKKNKKQNIKLKIKAYMRKWYLSSFIYYF